MDQIDDGGPAYPRQLPDVKVPPNRAAEMIDEYAGKSLRDDFAGLAMQSHLWRDRWKNPFTAADLDALAIQSYRAADAMIRARKKPPE